MVIDIVKQDSLEFPSIPRREVELNLEIQKEDISTAGMPELRFKAIIWGATFWHRTLNRTNWGVESLRSLLEINGISIQGCGRSGGLCSDAEFNVWGGLARLHPEGEPFVEGALGEIREALEGAGFVVTALDSDVTDDEL
jgi:hypothetical protein